MTIITKTKVSKNNSKDKYIVIENDFISKNKKTVCLTLDLEQDFGDLLEKPTYDSLKYISSLTSFLKDKNIPLTVFVQGSLLETYPEEIKKLSALDVEYELHSYSHRKYDSTETKYEIERGLKAYKSFFGYDPKGYRFPSGIFNEEDYTILNAHGFKFDSSVFPSIRPNAFNNLNMPTQPYYLNEHDLLELPFTVFSKKVRIPLALSYIKLIGWPYMSLIKTPLLPRFIIFNFHMHDLFGLPSASLITKKEPSLLYKFIYRRIYAGNSDYGFILLKRLISMFIGRGFEFTRMDTIYDSLIKSVVTQDELFGRGINGAT